MSYDDARRPTPPYIPFATLDHFLTELREQGLLPNEIDRSFLSKKSGSIQSWLPSALMYLGLLDGKKPTPLLAEIVQATDEGRTKLYAEIILDKYADLFEKVDMASGTTQQLCTWFKDHGIAATTVDRGVAFFLDACAKAEISVSPYFEKTNSRKSSIKKRFVKRIAQDTTTTERPPLPQRARPTALENTLLLGLVEQLPPPGEAFRKVDRDNWLALVPLILNSVYGPPDE